MAHQSGKRLASSLFALLLLLAAGVVFFALVQPLYDEVLATRGDQFAREEFLADQKKIVAQVKQIADAYADQGRTQEGISQALPLEPAVADALLQVQGIAALHNVSVRSYEVSVSAPPAPPQRSRATSTLESASAAFVQNVSTVNIRVELTGSYDDFKAFLDNIETNIRIFDVKNIAVQQAVAGKGAPQALSYTLNIAAYYQHQ